MDYTDQYLIRFDDVCANKHNFNEQSIEANKRANKENDRKFILNYITKNGTAYSKELANMRDIKKRVDAENFLTDKQITYIESTYERLWTAIAKIKGDPQLTGISARHDNKRTLKF